MIITMGKPPTNRREPGADVTSQEPREIVNLCSPWLLYCYHGMCILIKDLFVLLPHDVSQADFLLSFLSPSFLSPGELMHRRAARRSAGNDCYAADRMRPVSQRGAAQYETSENTHFLPHASYPNVSYVSRREDEQSGCFMCSYCITLACIS